MSKNDINKDILDILSKMRKDDMSLREAQQPAEETDSEYAIKNYPRLLQLVRAGLVPEDMVSKMTNILKDPKRFGVTPKMRDELYDIMIKTLNYIVVSDPAAWARFRSYLLDEEIKQMGTNSNKIKNAFREAIEEVRKEIDPLVKTREIISIHQWNLLEGAKHKPGEVWETENAWAGKNKNGEALYWTKSEHEDAQEKATAYAKGSLSQADAQKIKATAAKEKLSTDTKKNVASGVARAAFKKKTTKELDGPESKEDALGTDPKKEKTISMRWDRVSQVIEDRTKKTKGLQKEFQASGMDFKTAKKAAEKKVEEEDGPAPDFDMCTETIPGTNLFCGENLGIPRIEMPQLKTAILPGTQAEKDSKLPKEHPNHLPVNNGEANAEKKFLEHLDSKGVEIKKGSSMAAAKMKATQKDLVGEKVLGMLNGLKAGRTKRKLDGCEGTDEKTKQKMCKDKDSNCGHGNCGDEGLLEPLIVSKDGYVLDGHHRWAAIVALDMMDGKKENIIINTTIVDMDIEDLVDESNKWGNEYGLERKAGKAEVKKEHIEFTTGEALYESLTESISKLLRESLMKINNKGESNG